MINWITSSRLGNSRLSRHRSRKSQDLTSSGLARLRDAGNETLSIESRFDLAYNAAHALSLAALRKAGYRSENRYIVFQCLKHTLDLPNEQWRILDQAHRKRNLAEYEGHLDIDDALLEALLRTANVVAERLNDRKQINKGTRLSMSKLMNAPNVWVVRAGAGTVFTDRFLEETRVAIGGNALGPIRVSTSRQEMAESTHSILGFPMLWIP